MQQRIAYSILSVLYRDGKVRLPGIGLITLNTQPATISDADSTIYPPQLRSSFSATSKRKSRLLERYIAHRSRSTRTKARRELAQFVSQLRGELERNGTAQIEYIGTFSQDQDHIRFTADERYLNPATVLQSVPLPPRLIPLPADEPAPMLVSFQPPAMTPVIPSEEAQMEETEGQRAPDTPFPDLTPPQKEREEAEHEPVIPVVVPAQPAPLVVAAPVAKVATAGRPSEVSKRRTSLLIPALAAVLLLGILSTAFLFYLSRTSGDDVTAREDIVLREEPVQQQVPPVTIAPENEIEETADQIDYESITSGTEPEPGESIDEQPVDIPERSNTQVEIPSTYHTADGDCQVVVGAFSQQANSDRMIRQLEELGYQVVTLPRGRLTQIGVPADCEGEQLQALLTTLRTQVESQAWVFRPR